MGSEIDAARTQKSLPADTVVAALDALARQIEAGSFARRALALGITAAAAGTGSVHAAPGKRGIPPEHRAWPAALCTAHPGPAAGKGAPHGGMHPLGVLMHIAAGNADGLPVLSLAEGLVTGNINILKLPQADGGLSLELVQALIGLAPELADFIYVFDTPSSDIAAMRQMAAYSDGIVVWGGDAAVAAVRQMAPVGAKLIEWGHRLSFAYLSGYEDKARELAQLAAHIISTRQLLCSSCQVIFLDTEDMGQVHAFCEEFLPILEAAAQAGPPEEIGTRAQVTLRRYAAMLEHAAFGTGAQAGAPHLFRQVLPACGLRRPRAGIVRDVCNALSSACRPENGAGAARGPGAFANGRACVRRKSGPRWRRPCQVRRCAHYARGFHVAHPVRGSTRW